MAKAEHIPTPAVRRLSLYLRQLEAFQESGVTTVSSKQLGEALSLSDAQVRKDLAYFGQFGHPGIGYRVSELVLRVRRILGTDKISSVLLVGVGNLGQALLAFRGFTKRGFEVVAAFDDDPGKIGQQLEGVPAIRIQPLEEMRETARRMGIRVGMLTVPASVAQEVAECMVKAGVRGILNFAPVRLRLGPEVAISSVDLAVHLEQLSFQVSGSVDK